MIDKIKNVLNKEPARWVSVSAIMLALSEFGGLDYVVSFLLSLAIVWCVEDNN